MLHALKNNMKVTHTVHLSAVCIKQLHFKIHSDTTLLCWLQPGFLSLRVKLSSLPTLFLQKKLTRRNFYDRLRFTVGFRG